MLNEREKKKNYKFSLCKKGKFSSVIFVYLCTYIIEKFVKINLFSMMSLYGHCLRLLIKAMTIKQRKWRWQGHTLKKGQDDITIPKVIVRWADQNPSGWENSKMNLKRRPQNSQWSVNSCCFQIKMEIPCAWPTLFIEINGNSDFNASIFKDIIVLVKLTITYIKSSRWTIIVNKTKNLAKVVIIGWTGPKYKKKIISIIVNKIIVWTGPVSRRRCDLIIEQPGS